MKTIKTLALTFSILLTLNIYALSSPFESSVEGIDIPNTHEVDGNGKILRGMAPGKYLEQLVEYGITDVLIFKNQTRKEVDTEIAGLKKLGFRSKNIHHINFQWKDFDSFSGACRNAVDGLRIIRNVMKSSYRSLFFHCTVGEDRTGLLAGIFRMLNENMSKETVFENEICKKGFGAGNPHKPDYVVGKIRGDLRTLFLAMAEKIERGELSLDNLSYSACNFNYSFKKEILKKAEDKFYCPRSK